MPKKRHKVINKTRKFIKTLWNIGWFKSIVKGYPCRADGSEIPFMTYPIISLLEERLQKDLSVFEYGSGCSTIFFSKRVLSVTSVEYDRYWFDILGSKAAENVRLIFRPEDTNGEYCRSIQEFNENYDIVVIDGRDRVNCLEQAFQKLSDRGIIIFDDSQREKYSEAMNLAAKNGFLSLHFEGFKPCEGTISRTTLFYRSGNCLGI